jgi:hypothetical protein
MNRIRINTGNVGLVFKKGNYNRVMTEGLYWLMPNEKVMVYDLAKPFVPTIELNILLRDEKLAQFLIIVEVKDNEIAIQYINGNYKNILFPGRYAFWKGVMEYAFTKVDLSKIEITEDIPANILQKPEIVQFLRVYVVESYEKGILFLNGKAEKVLETGIYESSL